MVEKAIYNILSTDAGLVALQGTRVYPIVAPMLCQLPYMVFRRASSQERQDSQVGIAPLDIGHFEISVVDDDYFGAKTVAEELRLSFSRKRGTFASVEVQDVQFVDEDDVYAQVINGGERYYYVVNTTWRIAFVESTS